MSDENRLLETIAHCKQKLDFDRETFFRRDSASSSTYIHFETKDVEESSNKDKDTERIHVHLRLRPTIKQELQCYTVDVDNSKLIAKDQFNINNLNKDITEKHYKFTSILDADVDQVGVYEKSVKPILNDSFAERGATFLTYGCSSSGKTYTILGDESPGLVPRAITQLFHEYETSIVGVYPFVKIINDNVKVLDDNEVNSELQATNDFISENRKIHAVDQKKIKALRNKWISSIPLDHDFQSKDFDLPTHIVIWISFVEIYNEKIIDLLDMKKQTSNTLRQLKIFSNNGNSYIRGLTSLNVSTVEEALEILQYGLRIINYAATGINANSSRSHSIFTISLISVEGGNYEFSEFKFCDLAGAERIKKTGNVGDRLKEAGGINNSLLVLGRCLEIVHNNQKLNKKNHESRVPVRDSKLTLLLQSSLLGLQKFVMIVNILPKMDFFEENLNVLNFASIATQIVVQKTAVRKMAKRNSRYSFFTNHHLEITKANSFLANSTITSVEYINDLIEKQSLKTDKIKAVNVVHPGGLKFQALLLVIVQLVIKKELTRFTNKTPKSFNLQKAKLQYSSMRTVEKNLMQTVTSNIEVIKNKTLSINFLMDNILNSYEDKEIEFIKNWNYFNKKKLQDIKLRSIRIRQLKLDCSAVFHHAKKLLASKKREIITHNNGSIKELFDFFQNQYLDNSMIIKCNLEINDRVNYQCLLQFLHTMIPFINNYLSNFSYGGAETIPYEKKVISKFCNEMNELFVQISVFNRRYDMDIGNSIGNRSNRSLSNEAENQIKPYIVNTPKFKFDFSENCINLANINGPRLAGI
ncbi:unnamed protein product [Diamesa serratosioi]